MVRMEERPEWMAEETFAILRDGVRCVMSLVDRDAGVSIDLTFTDTFPGSVIVDASTIPADNAGFRDVTYDPGTQT